MTWDEIEKVHNVISFKQSNRVEVNIERFDFTNKFKCSDVYKFEKLKKFSINITELIFNQDRKKWKHKVIPIENSKNDSHKVIDFKIYKNHYALIKKTNVLLGDHHKKFYL